MTPSIEQFLPLIATASALVAIVVAAWALAGRRQIKQQLNRFDQRFAQLEKQVKLTTSGAVGMGQRILLLEEQLKLLQKQPDTTDAQDGAYTQAMQLFEQGIDADTVAASCGLSNAEASLMAMLRNSRGRAA